MLILCLSFVIVLLDQVTKYVVRANLELGGQIPVISGFFSISHVHNTGAAWGILSGHGLWLIALSIVMLVLIVIYQQRLVAGVPLNRIAVGLMISGILGNLIDRVRLGYVVDFLHFYWRSYQFPSFNVADSAICVGVGLYIITQTFPKYFSAHCEDGGNESSPITVSEPAESQGVGSDNG